MTIEEIIRVTQGTLVCGKAHLPDEVDRAFCSDLMSDVLTLGCSDILLITGLAHVQAIRTAEMADIRYILMVRDKEVTEEMIRLVKENDMVLIKTSFSMFKSAGILYESGLKPVY